MTSLEERWRMQGIKLWMLPLTQGSAGDDRLSAMYLVGMMADEDKRYIGRRVEWLRNC